MANLIAKLGLDSREFKAGLNSAKAATGGFQSTIKTAANGLRNMFDVALKPIAVVMAAIMVLRKAVDALGEIMFTAADNMRAIKVGNVSASIETLKGQVSALSDEYKRLSEEQGIVAAGMEKRAKVAEDLANAETKLARAVALSETSPGDTQRRSGIERDFDEKEKELELANKIARLEREAESKRESAGIKSGRSMDLKDQIKDAQNASAKAQAEADRLTEAALNFGKGGLKMVAGVVLNTLQSDLPERELEKRKKAANEALQAAKQAREVERGLREEQRKAEQGSLVDMAAVAEAENRIGIERLNEQARIMTERDRLASEAAQKLKAQTETERQIREQGAEELRMKAGGDRENLSRIQGRGLDADSMARVGGFLGGERPGFAVADKQLQVARERLEITRQNNAIMKRIEEAVARSSGVSGGDL
jgi:hypothetical protein